MGRQGDKNKKKWLKEEHITEEKATPVADQIQDLEKGSIFSCSSCFLTIFTVIIAVIVTSVIVKTAELQQVISLQGEAMEKMRVEAENANQQLQNLLSESIEKAHVDDILIKSHESEKEVLNAKLESLSKKFEKKDRSVDEYLEMQLNLQKIIETRDEEITIISENLKKGFQAFQEEKKSILEKLEISEQGRLSLQQKYENDLSNIKAENEEVTEQLKKVRSEKDEEIMIQEKSIESLEGENKILFDLKSQLSKTIQSLNTENEDISAEFHTKSEAVASLQEQNSKLETDLATLIYDQMQAMEGLEEEKRNCLKETEMSQNTLLEEISKLKENVNTMEEEKKILQTKMEDQISALSSEHEAQLALLEQSKSQLNAELGAEKHAKSVIFEEKLSLANALNVMQLEKEQVTKDLQETQISKEICNKEKGEGIQKLQELNPQIIAVKEDMSKVEAENKEIAEKLLKVETENVQGSKKLQEMENRFSALSQENSKLKSECKDISKQMAKMKTTKIEE